MYDREQVWAPRLRPHASQPESLALAPALRLAPPTPLRTSRPLCSPPPPPPTPPALLPPPFDAGVAEGLTSALPCSPRPPRLRGEGSPAPACCAVASAPIALIAILSKRLNQYHKISADRSSSSSKFSSRTLRVHLRVHSNLCDRLGDTPLNRKNSIFRTFPCPFLVLVTQQTHTIY